MTHRPIIPLIILLALALAAMHAVVLCAESPAHAHSTPGVTPAVSPTPTPAPAGHIDENKPRVEVFALANALAEEMVEQVSLLLSPEGRIVADPRTNSLIVKDYPAVLEQIRAFLKGQDAPRPAATITVTFSEDTQSRAAGAGIQAVQYGPYWQVRGGAGAVSRNNTGRRTLSLLVMDGFEGRIVVGENITRVDWFLAYAWGHGLLLPSMTVTSITTGFLVRPRIFGTEIILDITPFVSYPRAGRPDIVRFQEASTTVSLRDGETVALGGVAGNEKDVVGMILGGGQCSSAQVSSMVISARLRRSAPRAAPSTP